MNARKPSEASTPLRSLSAFKITRTSTILSNPASSEYDDCIAALVKLALTSLFLDLPWNPHDCKREILRVARRTGASSSIHRRRTFPNAPSICRTSHHRQPPARILSRRSILAPTTYHSLPQSTLYYSLRPTTDGPRLQHSLILLLPRDSALRCFTLLSATASAFRYCICSLSLLLIFAASVLRCFCSRHCSRSRRCTCPRTLLYSTRLNYHHPRTGSDHPREILSIWYVPFLSCCFPTMSLQLSLIRPLWISYLRLPSYFACTSTDSSSISDSSRVDEGW